MKNINDTIYVRISPIEKSLKCPKCTSIVDKFIEFIAKAVSKTSINEVSKELEIGYQEVKVHLTIMLIN